MPISRPSSSLAAIIGRNDVAEQLLGLVGKLRGKNVTDLLAKSAKRRSAEVERALEANNEEKASRAEDMHECLVALADGCGSIDELCGKIERIFVEVAGGRFIALTNAHVVDGADEVHRESVARHILRACEAPDDGAMSKLISASFARLS